MLLHIHKLTTTEVEYLLKMPIDSDESRRFHDKFRVLWEKRNGTFNPPAQGRWYPLVWFAAHERIMPEEEMWDALSRQTKSKE